MVENVFGILSAKFRFLRELLLLQLDKAEKIVLACVYFHNFLRKMLTSKNIYTPNGTYDHEKDGQIAPGNWRSEGQSSSLLPLQRVGRKSSQYYQSIMDEFAKYFYTNGQVSWQDRFKKKHCTKYYVHLSYNITT